MGKQVAAWRQALEQDAKKTVDENQSGSSVISLKSGVMSYNGDMLPDNKLECVVIAYTTAKTWFDRAYDPDDQAPPECFSWGTTPHENVPNPPHSKCYGCPMAEFGSAKQGKGPACKTRVRLAVMPVSALDDASLVGDAEIAVMSIPPTSVANWKKYASSVANKTGLPPWAVSTMISAKPHPKKQFEVNFEAKEPVGDDKLLAAIHGRIEEAKSIILKPYVYEDTEEKEEKY